MLTAASVADFTVSARDYLDFLFDGSGWDGLGESDGYHCAAGKVGGRETFAAALNGAGSPLGNDTLSALADFVRRDEGAPLILVLSPCELSDEPGQPAALSDLLAALARRRKRSAIIAIVLGELIGPVAILARLADIVCFGPEGALALADTKTSKRIASPNGTGTPAGLLSCTFATDAAAFLAVRRIVNRLPVPTRARLEPFTVDRADDPAFEHLAGSDSGKRVDERRLLQRLADDRTFMEFDSCGGLIACLFQIGGQTVGVLAGSATLSGALDAKALAQATALVSFCGRHSLSVVTLIDCPGVVPDDAALGVVANLTAAWEDSGVPVVSLVVRKAIGAASAALMPSSAKVLHWPEAKVGLLKDSAGNPGGRAITARETRAAFIETLASLWEARA